MIELAQARLLVADFLAGKPVVRRHKDWPRLRDRHLSVEPTCQVCDGTHDLAVHHIIPVSVRRDLELAPWNLITLCDARGCHFTFGHRHNWKHYVPYVRALVMTVRAYFREAKEMEAKAA